MASQENQGCLPAFLRMFATKPSVQQLPYRIRDDFLSNSELSFMKVLELAVGDNLTICPKVGLKDIFFVSRPNENRTFLNKIDRKHCDFLLCERSTLKPLLGIELDDSSHRQTARQERDKFVDDVFAIACLPLLRLTAKRGYEPLEIKALVDQKLGHVGSGEVTPNVGVNPSISELESARKRDEAIPLCPKCGIPFKMRIAARGPNKGQRFYGCVNYPKCKETAVVSP